MGYEVDNKSFRAGVFPVINGIDLPVIAEPEDIRLFCNAYNEYLGKPPVY
jgi:hypothetical protein